MLPRKCLLYLVNASARMELRTFSTARPREIKKIGFVGLGNMGSRMSVNLLKKGYQLTVSDLNETACKRLSDEGATVANNCTDLASDVDCIISMLPSSKEILSLYIDGGVVDRLKPGSTVIDCSTIDPDTSKYLGPIFKGKNITYVDAPVSGGIVAAENGTLTFMVGGEESDANHVQPVLLSMGKNIIHCGAIGSGLVAKMCNNLLLAISMMGVSEAMNIGIQLGMKPEVLARVINSSSGRCWSSDTYNPVPGVLEGVPSGNNYKPGFTVKMITKDLNIAKRTVAKNAISFELGEKTLALYESLANSDFGDKDFSIVYRYFEEKSRK